MKRVFLYPYAGPGGRNYFKQIGTRQDITLNEINLYEGLQLGFHCGDGGDDDKPDDLVFEGTVRFDHEKGEWYAIIDENSYRHASDGRDP